MEGLGSALLAWIYGLAPWFFLFVFLVLLDMLGGSALALARGSFDLERLPRFLITSTLYLWAWLTVEAIFILPILLGVEVSGLSDLFVGLSPKVVYALVGLKYGASIYTNVQQILAMDAWEQARRIL
jgi:hypothetical protein